MKKENYLRENLKVTKFEKEDVIATSSEPVTVNPTECDNAVDTSKQTFSRSWGGW